MRRADPPARRPPGARWAGIPPDVLPAHFGELDLPVAEPVKRALHAAVEGDDLRYQGPDPAPLAAAFKGFARRRLGWDAGGARVALLPGVMVGLTELLRVLLAPGAGVAVATPAYQGVVQAIAEAGCGPVEVPLASGGALDLDALGAALAGHAGAVLLCNPHNPTGRVAPQAELEAVAALADRHGAWVLSDEIWAPLALPGARAIPYLSVSAAAADHGIALTSASKAFGLGGLRGALAVTASARARAAVQRLPDDLHFRVARLGVVVAEAAFSEGDAWLDWLLSELADRRRRLAELLPELVPAVRWTPPDAGFVAWLDCRASGLGGDPAEAILDVGRLAVGSGLDFGAAGAGHVRLAFGTTAAAVEESVVRLGAALA